jgi:hypothetical protein
MSADIEVLVNSKSVFFSNCIAEFRRLVSKQGSEFLGALGLS